MTVLRMQATSTRTQACIQLVWGRLRLHEWLARHRPRPTDMKGSVSQFEVAHVSLALSELDLVDCPLLFKGPESQLLPRFNQTPLS